MRSFLRENWIYIVIPVTVVLLGLGALIVLGDDSPSTMVYNIW